MPALQVLLSPTGIRNGFWIAFHHLRRDAKGKCEVASEVAHEPFNIHLAPAGVLHGN